MSLLENAYQAVDDSDFVDALTTTLYENEDTSSPMTVDDDPFQPLPVPQYVEEETDEELSTQIQDPMDSCSTLDQSFQNVHEGLQNQSIAQYNASCQYESLLKQYKEKERYWRERCEYVESQLDVVNNEMRKMERIQQSSSPSGSDEDKDEIIRRLHAKIASRDSVIESLEEKVAQTERFSPSTITSGLPQYHGNHDMLRMKEMATNMHHIENAKKALSAFIKLKDPTKTRDLAFTS